MEDDPSKVPLSTFKTFEAMVRHIQTNIVYYSDQQISDMLGQFENFSNINGLYTPIIEFLNSEIETRLK